MARLRTEALGPDNENAAELATKLEQVIVDQLTETLHRKRVQLCGGREKETNGLAMWASGDIVEHAGVEALRRYGACTRIQDTPAHMDG